jgi:hypothetical protein
MYASGEEMRAEAQDKKRGRQSVHAVSRLMLKKRQARTKKAGKR